jgi:hypothetical protein
MVSVLQVYTALKDLANKEQKGFITPQIFNSFAPLAQMNVYNEIFSELVGAKRLNRQNFDPGRDKSVRKQKTEDLSYYFRKDGGSFGAENAFPKPSDLSKIISISVDVVSDYDDAVAGNERVNCEVVYDPEVLDRVIGSNLSQPTDSFPVALVSATDIEVFPETSTEYQMYYYAKPTSFSSDGTISANPPYYSYIDASQYTPGGTPVETFNFAESRNFMLPPHYLSEVVMELAKLIGIRLRDQQVSVFSTQEEAAE